EPRKIPISKDIITATKPIEKEIRAPISILLKRSLPYLSVPNKNVFFVIYVVAISFVVNPSGKLCKEISFSIPSISSPKYSVTYSLLSKILKTETGSSTSLFFLPKNVLLKKDWLATSVVGIVSILIANPGFLE